MKKKKKNLKAESAPLGEPNDECSAAGDTHCLNTAPTMIAPRGDTGPESTATLPWRNTNESRGETPTTTAHSGLMPQPVSRETRQRQSRARLSIKQQRFIEEYAQSGNGADAARRAGYKAHSAKQIAQENLTKPYLKVAAEEELARVALKITPQRVKRRLDEISRESQEAGQFGPAVRAEELLGKSIGMWIDQSIQLSGALNGSHVAALLEVAKRRQLEPIDLADDNDAVDRVADDNKKQDSDDERD